MDGKRREGASLHYTCNRATHACSLAQLLALGETESAIVRPTKEEHDTQEIEPDQSHDGTAGNLRRALDRQHQRVQSRVGDHSRLGIHRPPLPLLGYVAT